MTKPAKRYLEAEITVMKGFGGQEYPITNAIGEPLTLPELLAKEYPDLRSRIYNLCQNFQWEIGQDQDALLADAIIAILKGDK